MSTRTSIVLELTTAEAKRICNVLWRDDSDGPLVSEVTQGLLDALAEVGIKPATEPFYSTYKNESET